MKSYPGKLFARLIVWVIFALAAVLFWNVNQSLKPLVYVFSCIVLFVFLIFAVTFTLTPFLSCVKVKSISMEPTILNGDVILIENLTPKQINNIQIGSIVLVSLPELIYKNDFPKTNEIIKSGLFVKRVVGIGGDQISVKNGKLFVNDIDVTAKWYQGDSFSYELHFVSDIPYMIWWETFGDQLIIVPTGYCFLLGDNPNNSLDSHIFGFIPSNRVLGRMLSVIPLGILRKG